LITISPDINFLVLNEYSTIVTDNVNVRDYPDINSNKYIINYIDDNKKSIHSLLKGNTVYVIGRTSNKFKINNWDNYWYMVNVLLNEYDEIYLENKSQKPKTEYKWIYGEFLKTK